MPEVRAAPESLFLARDPYSQNSAIVRVTGCRPAERSHIDRSSRRDSELLGGRIEGSDEVRTA